MRKAIFFIFAIILMSFSTANASFIDDPTDFYGDWSGWMSEDGEIYSVAFHFGNDQQAHDPQTGYFYIPETAELQWSGTVTDDDGDTYNYMSSPLSAYVLQYQEHAPGDGWWTNVTFTFAQNLSSLTISGTGSGEGYTWDIAGQLTPSNVPLPAAGWLLISGLLAVAGLRKRSN